jgi:methionine-rich copper-binding protein CopC
MKGPTLLLIALGLLVGSTSSAFAHAHLKTSQPAAGSIVETAPTELTLWFTERLEPAFCNVKVIDGTGNRVDRGQAAHDSADPNVLHVALEPLSSGVYKIVWRVVATDGHAMTGTFAFTVGP